MIPFKRPYLLMTSSPNCWKVSTNLIIVLLVLVLLHPPLLPLRKVVVPLHRYLVLFLFLIIIFIVNFPVSEFPTNPPPPYFFYSYLYFYIIVTFVGLLKPLTFIRLINLVWFYHFRIFIFSFFTFCNLLLLLL